MAMKTLTISLTAGLLLLTASSLFAQNNLPDANDSACWQSLNALHQCAQAQQDRAISQAQRCTSYPEYQCQPEAQPAQNVHVAKVQKQKKSKVTAATAQSHQTTGGSSGSEAVAIDLNPANSLR
jgi:hypothetical protein